MLRNYYLLTKPGIIQGNAIAAIGGFLLAANGRIDWVLFLATIIGLSLVIASACVFNNFIDRHLDKKMSRTKSRALVTGDIPSRNALAFGGALGFIGFFILLLLTTLVATAAALVGFIFYVAIYGIAKRRTTHGTLVGTVPGAVPPVVGYTAVTNSIDTAALLLFLILVFWQMPHFYAIAIYRLNDYKKAGLPVLPAVKGIKQTKLQMILFVVGFIVVTLLLTVFGYTGITYALAMTFIGFGWLVLGLKGVKDGDDAIWARYMFKYSLLVLLIFSLLISVDTFLA